MTQINLLWLGIVSVFVICLAIGLAPGTGAQVGTQTVRDDAGARAAFTTYQIAHMNETQPIEVHIVNSSPKVLGGTGAVGPVTLVPAVVNAIFVATGKRYRSLPLSRHELKLV